MPVREGPPQPAPLPKGRMAPVDGNPAEPAERARGGEIILRTPARLFLLLAGLVGAFALGLLLLRQFG